MIGCIIACLVLFTICGATHSFRAGQRSFGRREGAISLLAADERDASVTDEGGKSRVAELKRFGKTSKLIMTADQGISERAKAVMAAIAV